MQALRKARATPDDLLDVFGAPHSQALRDMARKALQKKPKVYYFDSKKAVRDITDLALDGLGSADSVWGGLLSFSGRANAAVARAVANSDSK